MKHKKQLGSRNATSDPARSRVHADQPSGKCLEFPLAQLCQQKNTVSGESQTSNTTAGVSLSESEGELGDCTEPAPCTDRGDPGSVEGGEDRLTAAGAFGMNTRSVAAASIIASSATGTNTRLGEEDDDEEEAAGPALSAAGGTESCGESSSCISRRGASVELVD